MTRLATVINKIIDIINTKQPTLVSGENIKKLNGTDIVGSGNIPVKTVGGESILGDGNVGVKTINGETMIGSGDAEIVGTGTLTTTSQNVIGAINEHESGKATKAELTTAQATLNGRIDNIIAGGTAPSEAEIVDARQGADGTNYTSLGNAIRGQVSDLKSDFKNTNKGVSNLGQYATFVRGGLSSGVVQTSQQFRVASNDIITLDRDMVLQISDGFKIGVHTFVNGSYSADSGWQTRTYFIPTGTSFKIVIGRTSDDTTEVADVGLFVNQAVFSTVIGDTIKSLTDIKLIASVGRTTFDLFGNFARGGLHDDASLFPGQHHRVSSTSHFIADRDLQVYVADGYKCGYSAFVNSTPQWSGWFTKMFTISKGTEFVLQICNNPEDGNVYADIDTYVNAITVDSVLAGGIHDNLLISKSQLVQGSLQPREFVVVYSKPWLTYLHKTPVTPNSTITVKIPEIDGVTWKYRFAWYDSEGAFVSNTGDTLNNYCSFPSNAYYFAFAILATNNGTVDSDYDVMSHFPDNEVIIVEFEELIRNIASLESVVAWGFDTFVAKPSNVIDAGYSCGSNLLKHKVFAEKLSGNLLYNQGFCIYDNKYYSVEEGKLGIQDASFNTIETKTLSIGHGNNIQLGNSNLAYINGVYDHTVYVLNLDTKVVVGTISLPFNTGVDSAVIDDINNIAYILHSETSGEVYSQFEFVAYDLTNEEVLYTRHLPFKILQFQVTDFYEGKILLLAGTNDNIDNRLFVLDLNGTALANMKLSIFASDEPEGVFFDRDNGDLYVSSYYKKVYKLIPLA